MSKTDFQGLLQVLKAGEDNPHLMMSTWQCGTAACLIGSFCIKHRNDHLQLTPRTTAYDSCYPFLEVADGIRCEAEAIAVRFGITKKESQWLFDAHPFHKMKHPYTESANTLSPTKALARLRKFIYYKLHKQEMIDASPSHDPFSLPRKVSGNKAALLAAGA